MSPGSAEFDTVICAPTSADGPGGMISIGSCTTGVRSSAHRSRPLVLPKASAASSRHSVPTLPPAVHQR
jgi:hypothetical protein